MNGRAAGGKTEKRLTLEGQASMWSTPNVPNGGRTLAAEDVAARGSTKRGKRQVGLHNEAAHWSTPNARDWKGEDIPVLDLHRELYAVVRRSRTGRPGWAGAPSLPGPGDTEGWVEWLAAGGAQPALRRGSHGVSIRVDQLRCLGNAVVPAQAAAAFLILAARYETKKPGAEAPGRVKRL